ncbi:MAG: radical SAM protein [Thermoplasmata archaeon]|nr:radical SAM protein [Thermoplasmata archaeon]
MNSVQKALARYSSILKGEEKPWYHRCRAIPVELAGTETIEEKWKEHDEHVKILKSGESQFPDDKTEFSLLDLKHELANDMAGACIMCERRCGIDRAREAGHCGVMEPRISSEFMHYGEEPELVPSHTIFFSGCTFDCVFCQNWDISTRPGQGERFFSDELARMIDRRAEIAKNTNWVGGDPTSNLPFIIEILGKMEAGTAQVWNSNMYLTEESLRLLDGLIDVYLTDFKFGNNDCASRLCNAEKYWDVITRNHIIARGQAEVIIRHLVLPGHVECCSKPILDWIAGNLGNSVRVNIMSQYRPEHKAFRHPEINRSLEIGEFKDAYEYGFGLGLNLVD